MICGAVGMKVVGPAEEDVLRCALHHLTHDFMVVGVTERMRESLCVMSRVLGVPPPTTPPPLVNYNQYRHLSPQDARAVPDYYVRLDQVLYDYANSRLDALLLQYPECQEEEEVVGGREAAPA